MKTTDIQKLQQAINIVVVGKNYIDTGVEFINDKSEVIQVTKVKKLSKTFSNIMCVGQNIEGERGYNFPGEVEWLGYPINLEILIQSLVSKKDYFEMNFDIKHISMEITFDSTTYFEWEFGGGLEHQNVHTIDMLKRIFKV